MKATSMIAIASAVALSALAFAVTPGAATAEPMFPPGHYCLAWARGGTDCGFTSFAQCEATASGVGAVCYGDPSGDDETSRNRGWSHE